MNERPLLLVTNDDGVQAPGLQALAESLRVLGDVCVVAPDREVSACSQSLTLIHPLRLQKLREGVHSVDGTPADCVNLAIVKLLPRRPDLVVSGINRGGNLGDDIFYSGTVGGAREAAFFGVPALAMSLASRAPSSYAVAADFATRLAKQVLVDGLPPRTLLNVNVPEGEPRGAVLTTQGRREHQGGVLEGLDPRRQTYFWIEQGRDRWRADELSDVSAVRAGLVSVTPLQTDTTNHGAFEGLKRWTGVFGR